MSRPTLRLSLIDRYLLTQMAPPMAIAFAVVLISLLLYRILQIFNLLASSSAQFGLAARLVGGLLPHYLGLALPAGYFISVFVVVVRMSDSSELDALLASGLSLDRLTAPFVAVAVLVAASSFVLLGFLQPYGRYDYNLGMNEAQASGWNARLQAHDFVQAQGGRMVITADAVDPTGRVLDGVFVRRIDAEGHEQVFTARRGRIAPSRDGRQVLLRLENGVVVQERAPEPTSGSFAVFELEGPAAAPRSPFRARGAGPRELTTPELWRRSREGSDAELRRRAASEFHTRAVRTVSPLLLPLLAVPLGIAAKRARRSAGFAIAAGILMLYEYAIDGAQAAADLGGVVPAVAIWTPFALFGATCVGLYASNRRRPGQNGLSGAVFALAGFSEAALAALRPSARRSSASR